MINYDKEINTKILKICEEHRTSYQNILMSRKCSDILKYVHDCVSDFMDVKTTKLGKMLCWVLNEMQGFPKCGNPNCSNVVVGKHVRFNDPWPKFCCNRCAQKNPETIAKVKNTKLEHFGNANYNGDIDVLKKKNLEKYGVEWYIKSDDFKRKQKETWLSHGYEHPMKSEKLKREMEERYLKKTGYRYTILNPEIIKKARTRYLHDGLFFKSSWELAFYIYNKDNGIDFVFQPEKRFEYSDCSGKTHWYYPDFEINGVLYEIKGEQFLKPDGTYRNPYDTTHCTDDTYEAKRKCMESHGVVVIGKEEIRKYIDYCTEKYGSKDWKDEFRYLDFDVVSLEIERNDGNLVKEFEYFKNVDVSDRMRISNGNRNCIIKYFQQDIFFRKERELWKDNVVRERLLENRMRYAGKRMLSANDILTGFKRSGIYYGYSHFNPLWFKWFIQKYDVRCCYDPCGGWGHRLLGGLCLEKYIYNDLSEKTKSNVDRIVKFFNLDNVKTYCNDARIFMPDERFDAMFTCPPYFNVEEYECGKFADINDFNSFIDSIFDVFIRKDGCNVFGLVIREDLLPENHRNYSERYTIQRNVKKYISGKENRNLEYMYVFRKE
jgi:hypothetical protein